MVLSFPASYYTYGGFVTSQSAIGSVLDFQWLSLCLIAPSKNQTENPFTSDSKTL